MQWTSLILYLIGSVPLETPSSGRRKPKVDTQDCRAEREQFYFCSNKPQGINNKYNLKPATESRRLSCTFATCSLCSHCSQKKWKSKYALCRLSRLDSGRWFSVAQSRCAWEHLGSQKCFQGKRFFFFLNKTCNDKNGQSLSWKISFYFWFPVVTDVGATHEYVKATKLPRAEARESSWFPN